MNFYDFNNMRHNTQGKSSFHSNMSDSGRNSNSNINNDDYMKYNDYFSKSEDELKSQLYNTVNNMKSQGTFDINEIENFYNRAKQFLSVEQQERMRNIIDMLKGEQ